MDRREILKAVGVLLGVAISPSCSRALESGEDLNSAPISGELAIEAQRMIEILADLRAGPLTARYSFFFSLYSGTHREQSLPAQRCL